MFDFDFIWAFIFLLTFGLGGKAQAEADSIETLLVCDMGFAPVSSVEILRYGGRMIIIEKKVGEWTRSRQLTESEWSGKQIDLSDKENEITGILYKENSRWYYLFKRPDGWKMTGDTSCTEKSTEKK